MLAEINNFADCRILVVGDAMLDRYYYSEVTRISPEGPVPVALVKAENKTLGGAANVAHNLARLGCRVSLAGISGADEHRVVMNEKLDSLGIGHAGLIQVAGRPTTTKLRVIGGHQQMLRLDFEDSTPPSAVVVRKITAYLNDQLRLGVAAVIMSDYAKGVCTPSICQWIVNECKNKRIPLVVDPKGDHWQKYRGASLVTPNLKELHEVSRSRLPNTADELIVAAARKMCRKYDIASMVVTRSEKGMSVVSNADTVHIPTYAQEVFDVSGAGDTVTAVLGAGLAAGMSLVKAAHLANLAAGVVVGKMGTYAISRDELAASLELVKNEEWTK